MRSLQWRHQFYVISFGSGVLLSVKHNLTALPIIFYLTVAVDVVEAMQLYYHCPAGDSSILTKFKYLDDCWYSSLPLSEIRFASSTPVDYCPARAFVPFCCRYITPVWLVIATSLICFSLAVTLFLLSSFYANVDGKHCFLVILLPYAGTLYGLLWAASVSAYVDGLVVLWCQCAAKCDLWHSRESDTYVCPIGAFTPKFLVSLQWRW